MKNAFGVFLKEAIQNKITAIQFFIERCDDSITVFVFYFVGETCHFKTYEIWKYIPDNYNED